MWRFIKKEDLSMNSIIKGLTLALLITFSSSGCVDERSFYISGNQSECVTFDTEDDNAYLASGVVDISEAGDAQGYLFFPKVHNELLPTIDEDGEPERNRLNLERFEVELDFGIMGEVNSIPDELMKYSVPISGIIEPEGTATTVINIIPGVVLGVIKNLPAGGRGLIMAKIRAVADHNGSTLKSKEFSYAVEVCNGCLVTDIGECSADRVVATTVVNECGLPQDGKVSCCKLNGEQICLTAELRDSYTGDEGDTGTGTSDF